MMSILEKIKENMNVDSLDQETARMIERLAIPRISPKRINQLIHQLESKRMEMNDLACVIAFDEIKRKLRQRVLKYGEKRSSHFKRRS